MDFHQKKKLSMGAAASVIAIILLLAVYFFSSGPKSYYNTANLAGYFEDRMVALAVEDAGQPMEGFNAPLLMRAFPGLVSSDFNGVETSGGRYELVQGDLQFIANAKSPQSTASETLQADGYITLLNNLSKRLKIRLKNTTSVDYVIDGVNTADVIEAKIDQGGSSFGIQITPREILEDSRCPEDVQCIQAGQVRVRAIVINDAKEYEQTFILNEPTLVGTLRINLIRVEPKPQSKVKPKPNAYTFYFEVKRL